jgi:isopenicillin N synthase-like dioxygenase
MERPRRQLLSELSKILQPGQSIAKDRDHKYVSIGIHYYDPGDVHGAGVDFSPPHKDDGILTILLRTIVDEDGSRIANTEEDGLEIADLQGIRERNSGTIGKIAQFVPVPSHPQHAVAWIGTAFEFGQFPGCVHKVCVPGSRDKAHKRLSVAMFCGARQS